MPEELIDHRGWQQSVTQEGYTAGLEGAPRTNPYGSSLPGYNLWIYGYMLGQHDRRMEERNARS